MKVIGDGVMASGTALPSLDLLRQEMNLLQARTRSSVARGKTRCNSRWTCLRTRWSCLRVQWTCLQQPLEPLSDAQDLSQPRWCTQVVGRKVFGHHFESVAPARERDAPSSLKPCTTLAAVGTTNAHAGPAGANTRPQAGAARSPRSQVTPGVAAAGHHPRGGESGEGWGECPRPLRQVRRTLW